MAPGKSYIFNNQNFNKTRTTLSSQGRVATDMYNNTCCAAYVYELSYCTAQMHARVMYVMGPQLPNYKTFFFMTRHFIDITNEARAIGSSSACQTWAMYCTWCLLATPFVRYSFTVYFTLESYSVIYRTWKECRITMRRFCTKVYNLHHPMLLSPRNTVK